MSVRQDRLDLARELRADGRTPPEIAAVLRATYNVNGRVAARLARGWSQSDAADAWTRHWPDEPKTFKNISYWETWPGPTGHAPSLAVLDRMAQLYGCAVADLVAGWGEHGPPRPEPAAAAAATLAWQVSHLDLPELTRSVADWAERLPTPTRRALLLKLSTAAAAAAPGDESVPTARLPLPSALAGVWGSTYTYISASRPAELRGTHTVDLRAERGRLLGRSRAQAAGSVLDLDLTVAGSLATGTWRERTSPTGHYRAATYDGVLQLVIDPTGRSMSGRWLGVGKRYTIKSGEWRLTWMDQREGEPVTTAMTVDPAESSPRSTRS